MESHPDLLNLLKAARERRNFKVDEWIDQKVRGNTFCTAETREEGRRPQRRETH